MRLPKVMPRESSRSQAMTLLPCLNRGLFFFYKWLEPNQRVMHDVYVFLLHDLPQPH